MEAMAEPVEAAEITGADPGRRLNDPQLLAAEHLVEGMRPGAVANKLQIDRATLWRWTKRPEFVEHIERLRAEGREAREARLWRLLEKATDIVEKRLDANDSDTALAVLRLLSKGALVAPKPKEVDA